MSDTTGDTGPRPLAGLRVQVQVRGEQLQGRAPGVLTVSLALAGGDEERDDGDAAGQSGEVQRGVGFVGEVWVEEEGGVEADEAGDEDGVVELDCSAEAGGGVDPVGRDEFCDGCM